MLFYLATQSGIYPNDAQCSRLWDLGPEITDHTLIRVFKHKQGISHLSRPILIGKGVRLYPVGIAYTLDKPTNVSVDPHWQYPRPSDVSLPSVEQDEARDPTYSPVLKHDQVRYQRSHRCTSPKPSQIGGGHWICNGDNECRCRYADPAEDVSPCSSNSHVHDTQIYCCCPDDAFESHRQCPPDDQQRICTRSRSSVTTSSSGKRKYEEYSGNKGSTIEANLGAPDGWFKCSCCLSGWYNIKDYIDAGEDGNDQDT